MAQVETTEIGKRNLQLSRSEMIEVPHPNGYPGLKQLRAKESLTDDQKRAIAASRKKAGAKKKAASKNKAKSKPANKTKKSED